MKGKGWTSAGLKTVGDDDTLWTVAEAACHLGPPVLTVAQVRDLVRIARLEPVGKRQTGRPTPGRQPRVYRAVDFIRAYEALSQVVSQQPRPASPSPMPGARTGA